MAARHRQNQPCDAVQTYALCLVKTVAVSIQYLGLFAVIFSLGNGVLIQELLQFG